MNDTWPDLSVEVLLQVHSLIDQYWLCETRNDVESIARKLIAVTDAQPWDEGRSFWRWLVALSETDCDSLWFLEATRFAIDWHEQFLVRAGYHSSLGTAETTDMADLLEAAFTASGGIDGTTILEGETTVSDLRRGIAVRLNRPIDVIEEAGRARSAISKTEDQDPLRESVLRSNEGILLEAQSAVARGDRDDALALLESAAKTGEVRAMTLAAAVAMELGKESTAKFWAETSFRSGCPEGAYILAQLELNAGHRDSAYAHLQSAAGGGFSKAYVGLQEWAAEAGEFRDAEGFARQGAQAGEPQSMYSYATCLFEKAEAGGGFGSREFQEGREWLERAATGGHAEAMVQAGVVCLHLGQSAQGEYWLKRAWQAGDARAEMVAVNHGVSLF